MTIKQCKHCKSYDLVSAKKCVTCNEPFPVKRQAKRSPARVSLQRRVGRSASDGRPEAVARPIGRKKAVRSGNPYYLILSPLVNAALVTALEGTKLAQLTQYKQGGDIVEMSSNVIRQARILMESQTGAASRRRQRAIPANEKLTDAGGTRGKDSR